MIGEALAEPLSLEQQASSTYSGPDTGGGGGGGGVEGKGE